jgi:hypothetical protein
MPAIDTGAFLNQQCAWHAYLKSPSRPPTLAAIASQQHKPNISKSKNHPISLEIILILKKAYFIRKESDVIKKNADKKKRENSD